MNWMFSPSVVIYLATYGAFILTNIGIAHICKWDIGYALDRGEYGIPFTSIALTATTTQRLIPNVFNINSENMPYNL
jgi:hypothetical protein